MNNELPSLGWTTAAHVVRVIDGDTLDVEVTRTIRVRLLGVDAPELRHSATHAKAVEAREYVVREVFGKDVVLQIPAGNDVAASFTFGRVLGNVFLSDGRDLAEMILIAEHAQRRG